MTLTRDELERLLAKGVVIDIAKADRAYALLSVIGQHAEEINASQRNYGELFGTVQHLAATETLISVARLYDKPGGKYPTRCLRALLDRLERDVDALPTIVDKINLSRVLAHQGMRRDAIDQLTTEPDSIITQVLVKSLRDRLDAPDTATAVECVKYVRDKAIAHNEDMRADTVDGPTQNAVVRLLAFAKEVVGVVGWAYLSRPYMVDGTYLLTSDVQGPSLAMRRLLKELGIVEPHRSRMPGSDAPDS